ncbi:hypothetical protein KUTeg_002660 [Tegillarca granosa]|uniref:ODAD1 central coiled coil region domain-containing protein n=1 Tax=Tegillarca granosa TaxID=220873 RepID=A0ABQ9FZF7_TEGGR|nr:hypothetical protein KUTeg_002660 [Tegillarca granosa]
MPRPRSARSDNSDGDMEGVAEQELIKLQRQYRIMEGDRKAYTEESQNVIRKQRSEISQLEAEKQDLLKELRLAESRSNQCMDEDNTDTLVTLVEAKDDYDADIEQEKKNIIELDAKIREWEKKIKQQHKNMGGVHMSSSHTVQTQKTIRTLENRLDKCKKEFNTILTNNACMREEIESLRVERNRFDHLYKKLDRELTSLRKQKAELIESSTQAYDQRDEAQAKMILLKEKADKDMQQHNAEMKELLRIIDHERNLRIFMGIKGQERQEDPQLVAWRQKKEALEAERKKESQEDSVETYEAAFEKIKEMTGEEDLDLLVNKFIEVEDRNFALFNYVNEQNNEIEKLHEQIEEIKNDIEKFKLQGLELESQRKTILKELEDKQNKASKDADEYEEKNKAISKILDQLRAAAPQAQLPILPPSVGDEYESEGSEGSDDEIRPMTRNELQNKVMKTVKKRESAARKEGFRYDLSQAREKTKNKKDKK